MLWVLSNIRSSFNVGSIFRSADSLGSSLILVGYTPRPIGLNTNLIHKTALGAEKTVNFETFEVDRQALEKYSNFKHFGIEICQGSTSLFDFLENSLQEKSFELEKICLWFGNEVNGLEKNTLIEMDQILHLPMQGHKESLNVASTVSATGYLFRFYQQLKK